MAWKSSRTSMKPGVGEIECTNCEAVSTTEIIVSFEIWWTKKYNLGDKSLKLFYTTTPGTNNQYVYVTKSNAHRWYKTSQRGIEIEYKLTGLTPGTTYYIRPWLQLLNNKGKTTDKLRLASPPDFPMPETTLVNLRKQALVEIAKPSTEDPSSGSDIPEPMEFIDITQYITAPSYDVNNTDVTEDWTDANYTTHRIVARTKVSGKFNMIFKDLHDYNKFYNLMRMNREIYGEGYTYLRVQINNELDYNTPGADPNDVTTYKCKRRAGLYFVKIDSNPWVEPYFGRFDKYQAISVSIEEA